MRLFVGVMFMQFGIRHLVNFTWIAPTFPAVMGMSPAATLVVMITIELVCPLFIMTGFLTRLAVLPPLVSMIVAEYYILYDMLPNMAAYGLTSTDPGYLPIMFIGIYLYILLAGPGRVSVDYLLRLYLKEQIAITRTNE